MKSRFWLCWVMIVAHAPLGALAVSAWPPKDSEPSHVRPRLIAETTGAVAGQTLSIGVSFDLDRDWHLYWKGQNDSGMPIGVNLQLPAGFTAGPIAWPAPVRFAPSDEMLDYIYVDQVTLLVPINVPPSAKAGDTINLSAKLDWLVCKNVCVSGEAAVTLAVPVVASIDQAKPSADAARFTKARQRLTIAGAEAARAVESRWNGNKLTLTAPGAASIAFFPDEASRTPAHAAAECAAKGNSLVITFGDSDAGKPVVGVVQVDRMSTIDENRDAGAAPGSGAKQTRWYEISVPSPAKDKPASEVSK